MRPERGLFLRMMPIFRRVAEGLFQTVGQPVGHAVAHHHDGGGRRGFAFFSFARTRSTRIVTATAALIGRLKIRLLERVAPRRRAEQAVKESARTLRAHPRASSLKNCAWALSMNGALTATTTVHSAAARMTALKSHRDLSPVPIMRSRPRLKSITKSQQKQACRVGMGQ